MCVCVGGGGGGGEEVQYKLQADKSLEPLPIILAEISHLQNKIADYKIKKGQ